jgi:hypothetical protein
MTTNGEDASERIVWRVLDDEAVILDVTTGYYFSLNPVATDAWVRLHDGLTPAEVVDAVADKYGVDRETVRRDVDELLSDLRAAALWE